MANAPDSSTLLRIDDKDSGYVALDVAGEPSLVATIEELQEEGESKRAATERLAAAPAARSGSGSAASEFGEHYAFIAVDPKSRRGCLVLTYGHGEEKVLELEGVRTLRSELRKLLVDESSELIGLCGGSRSAKIEIEVPSELPRVRRRSPAKKSRRG